MVVYYEVYLEIYVVKKLVESGWVEGYNSYYDLVWVLYFEDVVGWVKDL